MQNEVRELIFFPSNAPELLSMTAADRDHWLMQETRRARARTIQHGLASVRAWIGRRVGLASTQEQDNVVSVEARARGERRHSDETRHVA